MLRMIHHLIHVQCDMHLLKPIGNAIKWIFAPLGFANIKATIATVMGLVAKEEVVGVFGVLRLLRVFG